MARERGPRPRRSGAERQPARRAASSTTASSSTSRRRRSARRTSTRSRRRCARCDSSRRSASHDIDFKTKVVEKLLEGGDKVKVSVMFRGREITHPEIGRELLLRVAKQPEGPGVVERQPSMEGRFMNMYLAPVPPKQVQKPKAARERRATRSTPSPAEDGGWLPRCDTAMARRRSKTRRACREPPSGRRLADARHNTRR